MESRPISTEPHGAQRNGVEPPAAAESRKAQDGKASSKRKAPARAKAKAPAPRPRKKAAATRDANAPKAKKAATQRSSRGRAGRAPVELAPAEIERMIATAAYFIAEKRNFEPGNELDDWFAAEHEIRRRQASQAA